MSNNNIEKMIDKSYDTVRMLKQAGVLEDEIKEKFPSTYEMSYYYDIKQENIMIRQTHEKLRSDCMEIRNVINELKRDRVAVDDDSLFFILTPMIVSVCLFTLIVFTDRGSNSMKWIYDGLAKFMTWLLK